MAIAPSDIQAQINKNLAAMRDIHDDPNNDLSTNDRAALGSYLSKAIPAQAPVTQQDVFPMTNALMQNAEDVSKGNTLPWDWQHPVQSAVGKLQTASGIAAPFLAPVTGALDLFGDAIKGVARPAIESMTGQDPQLNFAEKAQRGMTTNRNIGDVALQKAVQDFPSRVQQLVKSGIPINDAVKQARLEGLAKWVGGGTVENIMNVGVPEAIAHAPQMGSALADGIQGLRGTPPAPVGVPDIIPPTAQPVMPRPQFNAPAPEVTPPVEQPTPAQMPQQPSPAAVNAPVIQAKPIITPSPIEPVIPPPMATPPNLALPIASGDPAAMPTNTGAQSFDFTQGPPPPTKMPSPTPPEVSTPAAPLNTNATADLHSAIWEKLKGEDVSKVRLMLHELNQRMVLQPDSGKLYQMNGDEINNLADEIANSFKKSNVKSQALKITGSGVRPASNIKAPTPTSFPVTGKTPQWLKDSLARIEKERSIPKTPFIEQDLNNPSVVKAIKLDPSLNEVQKSAILNTRTGGTLDDVLGKPPIPEAPAMRVLPDKQAVLSDVINKKTLSRAPEAPAETGELFGPVRDPGQQEFDFTKGPEEAPVSINELRAKLRDPNISDAEFEQVQKQIADLKVPDKSAGIIKEPVKGPIKAPVNRAPAETPTPDLPIEAPKVKKLSSAVLAAKAENASFDDMDELTPVQEAKYKVNQKTIADGQRLPSPVDDLNTIIKGNAKRLKSKRGSTGGGELSPEEHAAIDRWKNEHAPAILASIKASGKGAYEHLKDSFPDLPEEHLRAMSQAATDAMPKAVPPSSEKVPVTTKLNAKGEELGQYKGDINLTKHTDPAVAGKIMDVIEKNPEIAKGAKVSDKQVQSMANMIHDGANTEKIAKLIKEAPAGTVPAELRASNQKTASAISAFLKSDLGKESGSIMESFEKTLAPQIKGSQKVLSEAGRTLREGSLPIDAQKKLAGEFDDAIKRLKNDPTAVKNLQTLKGTVLGKEFNPSLADKAYYIWINGLVSGKHTYAMKTASDALNMLGRFPARVTESMWDSILSLGTGERTKSLADLPKMMKGLFSGPESMPRSLQPNVGHVLTDEDSFKNVSPLQDEFSKKYIEPFMYGTKGLKHISQFFGQKMAQMEYEAIKGRGLDPVTLKDMIGSKALGGTLSDGDTKLIRALQYVKKNVPGARWFLPFQNTVGSILKQTLNHSPYGLVDIAVAKRAGTLTQADLAERLTALTHGTVLMGLAYGLWKKGLLHGDISTDSKVRNHQLNDQHIPENSVQVGNKAIPLDSIAPYGSILSLAANMFDGFENGAKNTGSLVNATISSILQGATSLAKRSSLAGVQNAVGIMADAGTKGPKALGQIASGFVPTAVKNVADAVDPTQRQASTPIQQLERRVPFVSKGLQPVIDTFGNPVQKPKVNIANLGNPFNIQDTTETPEQKIIDKTPLSAPEKTINRTRMTPQDSTQVQEWAGQYKTMLVDRMAGELANLNAEEKQYVLNKISSAANDLAVKKMEVKNRAYLPKSPFSSRSR